MLCVACDDEDIPQLSQPHINSPDVIHAKLLTFMCNLVRQFCRSSIELSLARQDGLSNVLWDVICRYYRPLEKQLLALFTCCCYNRYPVPRPDLQTNLGKFILSLSSVLHTSMLTLLQARRQNFLTLS